MFSSNVPRLVQSIMLHPTECLNQKVISCDIVTSKGELVEVPKDALGTGSIISIIKIYLSHRLYL